MIYGLIDQNIHEYYTYMNTVFDAIENAQKQYNWLVTDCVCYPKDKNIKQMLDREYCWLSGDELSELTYKEDFQWIWGALCGFEKDIPLDEILKHPLPSAENYDGYYNNPVSFQHPLSSLEIIPCDSSWVILISKNKSIIDSYKHKYPQAEDLSAFNERSL